MTSLIRGELMRAWTARTVRGHLISGGGLPVVNVLIVSHSSVLDTASDKPDALAAAALFAVAGVGALVRNQIAGVICALILAFLGMELLAVVNAVGLTPFGATAVLGGGTSCWGAAALVTVLRTVPLLIAAIVAERRRDLA